MSLRDGPGKVDNYNWQCLGSEGMQGEIGGGPTMIPRRLILVSWQVMGLLMTVSHTGGKAGCPREEGR